MLNDASLRCWGLGFSGQLGYGSTANVGDVDTPASAGPVSFGGHTIKAVATGDDHTCAIVDDGRVRCWGFGGDGRLGYGNTNNVLDPNSVGPVYLGAGRTAVAITAGGAHTCAILDNGSVLCWGFGGSGQTRGGGDLGYGNPNNVGDTPSDTPGQVGPVNLGAGPTGRPLSAKVITAGGLHTCVILDDGTVRCWGIGDSGRLGYGNTDSLGDTSTTTPDKLGPVYLGQGRTAVAISAGGQHTCANLDNGAVLCWGLGSSGQLGYGSTSNVGDTSTDTPGMVGPVYLGTHTARAISAGGAHTCAILDDSTVHCWGSGLYGRLGYPTLDSYGNQPKIGDKPSDTPGMFGPVDIGTGRTASAISAGGQQTCARLDDASVRCWGYGKYGRLGYCNTDSVGETNTPGSAGPVNLQPEDGGATCPTTTPPPTTTTAPTITTPTASTPAPTVADVRPLAALRAQALRAQALRRCLARAAHQPKRQRNRARSHCLQRYGHTPGRIPQLGARALSSTEAMLTFAAPGTDGTHPPAARAYLVKQSLSPIRNRRDFLAAKTLCHGYCRFNVTVVGRTINLTITSLESRSAYYYAIKARDNVSRRLGPRSPTAKVTLGGPLALFGRLSETW